MSAFGGDGDVIGRILKLNDEAYTIVGVMPATATVASWTAMAGDVWIPLALTDKQRVARESQSGRRRTSEARRRSRRGTSRDGRDLDTAWARVPDIGRRLERRCDSDAVIVGHYRTMLLMLLGAVGLVLLIPSGLDPAEQHEPGHLHAGFHQRRS
jgi:hypothetical protein